MAFRARKVFGTFEKQATGYNNSFPIFSNPSNAEPSIAKTKIMAKRNTERETVNKRSKQYFIRIGLLLIELP